MLEACLSLSIYDASKVKMFHNFDSLRRHHFPVCWSLPPTPQTPCAHFANNRDVSRNRKWQFLFVYDGFHVGFCQLSLLDGIWWAREGGGGPWFYEESVIGIPASLLIVMYDIQFSVMNFGGGGLIPTYLLRDEIKRIRLYPCDIKKSCAQN